MLSVFAISAHAHAAAEVESKFRYPFYIGIIGGYGATTWEGLVPKKSKNMAAIMMSTPVEVTEGGVVWGAYVGYEYNPYFALEGSYARYPNAKVSFDPSSLFSFEHNGLASLSTHTETAAINGKIMLIIPCTTVRAYSSFGVAGIHRYDQIVEHWRATPTFGVGLNYNFTDHVMGEFGANYTAGYGESELSPAEDYLPFLYSVVFRVAYRFGF